MKIDSKLKQDIKMIQMRNYMDPKRYWFAAYLQYALCGIWTDCTNLLGLLLIRFYKNPDKMGNILHTGTVIEGPSEYKSSRLTNRERKQTIVDEILGDKKIKDYSKKKFLEIQTEKTSKHKAFKADRNHKKKVAKAKRIRKLF